MTKIVAHFRLTRPLDDTLLERISDAHSLYGIQHVKVEPSGDALTVEYDATRLRPAEVEAALAGAGLPVSAV